MNKEDNMTLAEHAECWWTMQGNEVPSKTSPEYTEMYEKWVDFAFSNLTPNPSQNHLSQDSH